MKTVPDVALMCRVTGLYPKFFGGGYSYLKGSLFFLWQGFPVKEFFLCSPGVILG